MHLSGLSFVVGGYFSKFFFVLLYVWCTRVWIWEEKGYMPDLEQARAVSRVHETLMIYMPLSLDYSHIYGNYILPKLIQNPCTL